MFLLPIRYIEIAKIKKKPQKYFISVSLNSFESQFESLNHFESL